MENINIWNILALMSFTIAVYMFIRSRKQDNPKPIKGWIFANEYNDASARFNKYMDDILLMLKYKSSQIYRSLLHKEIDGVNYIYPVIKLEIEDNICVNNFIDQNIDEQKDNSINDENLLRFCKNELRKNLTDNPTFRLTAFKKNQITLGLSTYYQTLSSSDIHFMQFIANMPSSKKIEFNKSTAFNKYASQPFFKKWEEQLTKIIENKSFSHYSASIGCSVLTLFKDKSDGYCFYIISNSTEKNGSKDAHVVPSFMFQPTDHNIETAKRELDLQAQVLREFGEEILGIEEFENPSPDILRRGLDSSNNINRTHEQELIIKLARLLKEKRSELFITGVVIDAFRLRPEITLLLFIDDDNYMDKIYPVGNWESAKKVKSYRLKEYIKFYKRDKDFPFLCAPGIAALINGVEYAKQNLSDKIGEIK